MNEHVWLYAVVSSTTMIVCFVCACVYWHRRRMCIKCKNPPMMLEHVVYNRQAIDNISYESWESLSDNDQNVPAVLHHHGSPAGATVSQARDQEPTTAPVGLFTFNSETLRRRTPEVDSSKSAKKSM